MGLIGLIGPKRKGSNNLTPISDISTDYKKLYQWKIHATKQQICDLHTEFLKTNVTNNVHGRHLLDPREMNCIRILCR